MRVSLRRNHENKSAGKYFVPVHVQVSSITLLKYRNRNSNDSSAFYKVTDIPQLAEYEVTDSHSPPTSTDHQTAEFVKQISPFRNGR